MQQYSGKMLKQMFKKKRLQWCLKVAATVQLSSKIWEESVADRRTTVPVKLCLSFVLILGWYRKITYDSAALTLFPKLPVSPR